MGATNFLSGIIHAFVVLLYVYTWYWTGFNTWQRFHLKEKRECYHFISWWIFLNQTFYFIVIFCCDLLKVFFEPACILSYHFIDYYFCGVIVPTALHSFLIFWVSRLLFYFPLPFFQSVGRLLHLGSGGDGQGLNEEDSPSHRNRALPAIAKDSQDEAKADTLKFKPPYMAVGAESESGKEKQEALAQLSSKTRSSEIQIEHDENLRMHCIDVLNVKTAAATNTNRNGVPPSLVIPSIKPPSQRDEISKIGMNNFLSINTNFDDQRPSSATSRNVSFDGRSEHFEMTTPRIEVPTRDEEDERRLSNNPLPSPGAPPINPFPPQNTDLSVILPDFYYGIPTWVLQVTHSVVGLSVVVETLLSQPRMSLSASSNILLSLVLPSAYALFIIILRLRHIRSPSSSPIKLSFVTILLALFCNCCSTALCALLSVYFNSSSRFLHSYIDTGFESAMVMDHSRRSPGE